MSELRKRILNKFPDEIYMFRTKNWNGHGIHETKVIDGIESLIIAETKELREALEDMTRLYSITLTTYGKKHSQEYANAKRVLEKYKEIK